MAAIGLEENSRGDLGCGGIWLSQFRIKQTPERPQVEFEGDLGYRGWWSSQVKLEGRPRETLSHP